MQHDGWPPIAHSQAGLLTRAQLAAAGIDRWAVRHRVRAGRWRLLTPTVLALTTGELSQEQRLWLGVLHAGEQALVGELTAAEHLGLRNWHRDTIVIVIPHEHDRPSPVPGYVFRRSRRPLAAQRRVVRGLPVCRIEPAVLTWAARERSLRAADGVLAATVQQGLAPPEGLIAWIERLSPLRGAVRMRRTLTDIAGGAQSVGELDVRRMCKAFGLALPRRQVRRRDTAGRVRFTDCEWLLPGGRVLVLEVDGGFHMEAEHWEDDLARQRALTSPSRLIVRCTTRELRDQPEVVARDLLLLGVPAA